jgi:molybdopterin-guanine dinucleotide biosynthesis protein A
MNRGAIILCGGRSTRMGRDKAALPFGRDETILQRVVRLLGIVVPPEHIVCVAAEGQLLPRLPAGVSVVIDRVLDCGPLAGLAEGLAAIENRAEAVFVTGCDAPLLAPAFIERMFTLLGAALIAAPHDSRNWHPLPAVYRTSVLPAAVSLLAAGERSLVALLEVNATRRVSLDELRDVDPELLSLASCNTPADYEAALLRQ